MSKLEVKIPAIGESVTEVTLASWLVQDGDYVKLDQPLAEFESDKATFELPAEAAGVFTRDPKATEGADMKIGDVIGSIDTSAAPSAKEEVKSQKASQEPRTENQDLKTEAPKAEVKPEPAPAAASSYATGSPSPAAKKILEEKNIPAAAVSGSGPGGRITKDDALKAEKKLTDNGSQITEKIAETKTVNREPTTGNFSRNERVEKMSRIRKTISRRLVQVKNETAMLTTFNEIDMTRINQIREQYKKTFEERNGIGLGFMSFFTKACTIALQKYPAINAYIDDENIIYHDYCDISIAVSTPKGLVVPVIRNAESLSFAEIEKEVKRLALKGRDGELTLEDMDGGTFTITNGGVFGSLMSTPIINQPQSAILGMHKVQDRPMAINGQVVIRPMMYLALSYDHRIVDGKESVGFLVTVKDMLENPEKMLFGADPVTKLLEL